MKTDTIPVRAGIKPKGGKMGKISGNMPKTLRRWLEKHPDLFVDAIFDSGYNDGNAYDILLSRGHCECGNYGRHTIIEYTVKDALSKLRSVEKCGCLDCLTGNGW